VFRFFARFASRPLPPHEAALLAIRRGAYHEAVEQIEAILADPSMTAIDRAFWLNKRGVARIGAAQPDAARDDFHAALACVAKHPPALTNLGNLLLESGDAAGAIARYEEAIRADDGYALAHQNLGVAYKRIGRLDEGVRALRRAQRLEGRLLGKPRKRP
jgi:tetratricopeptide (TPR) repeat protein